MYKTCRGERVYGGKPSWVGDPTGPSPPLRKTDRLGHGLYSGIQCRDRNQGVCKFFIFPAVETMFLRAEVTTSSGETRASY